MALTLAAENAGIITVDEYAEHIETEVDLNDLDSLIESAPALRALMNNRTVLADVVEEELRNLYDRGHDDTGGARTLLLAKRERFHVRANIWTPPRVAGAAKLPAIAPYVLHDHNFTFLTGGYAGPGYTTDLYEVDPSQFTGEVGETVELRFIERATLTPGRVMLYRAGRDVHTQEPPPSVSISINLVVLGEAAYGPQFYFDAPAGRRFMRTTITHCCDNAYGRPIGLCEIAGQVGGERTADLLDGIAERAVNPEVRRAAAEARDALVQRAGAYLP